jgi:DNA-binding NtrC family response regulator
MVAVVMMTGYATSASEQDASEAGASGFLPKPFEEAELLTMVRRALGGGENEEEES